MSDQQEHQLQNTNSSSTAINSFHSSATIAATHLPNGLCSSNGAPKSKDHNRPDMNNNSRSMHSTKASVEQQNEDAGPHILLEFSIPTLLLALVASELLAWQYALVLYILFRMVRTDYGRRAVRTLPRDVKGLFLLIRIKLNMRRAFRSNQPLHVHFLRQVQRQPDKTCLIEVKNGRTVTFAQFNAHTNKYANLFKTLGYRKEDVLALFMENGIEFFGAWLGLSKLGVISAWINTNLKAEPLAHSIRAAHCRSVLTTPSLLPVLMNAQDQGLLPENLTIYVTENGEIMDQKDGAKMELRDETEPQSPESLNFQSVLCYIYTSGTTGNPKAAIIKHYRYYLIGCASGYAFGIRPSDRLYIQMPMYHSAGGILGASQVLIRGCSAAIREKFSARNFWKDCIQYECTVSQYIGEICRYLLAQPPHMEERTHPVRMMFGNGLRPQIWRDFVRRFGIERIGELYGSTEGNSNLVNIDNHTGSCGFMPIYKFLHPLYPIRLLKVDADGELVRDSNGYCVQCKPGDTGEVVATIRPEDPLLRFEGYVSQVDTQKKIITDCQRPGDNVFTSGDILHWDRLGYLYFKDRRGDTYRWRGENVSTMEVEGVLQPLQCIEDATVYGVEVPGREGRAGMIGVALAESTDIGFFIDQISKRLRDQLATYAIPVFLRICTNIDKTATFKLKKSQLQKEGFQLDQDQCGGLFFWNSDNGHYAPLTRQILCKIESGEYTKI